MNLEPNLHPVTPASPSGTQGVLDVVTLLAAHRKILVRFPVGAVLLGTLVAFLWPKSYLATARILAPQQSQSTAAAMLAQLGGAAAGLAGGALGLKNSSDLYVGMLKSDAVSDALINRFALREVYGEELLVDARKELAEDSLFTADKAGIITIKAEARDPRLAADLANAFVSELQRLTSTLAVTEAAQRRVFFEQQLQQTKEKLAEAELALRRAIETGGIVSVDAQSRAVLETVGRIRAQISAKEIQIDAMRGFATSENPDLLRAEKELSSMRRELDRLESGTVFSPGAGLTSASAKGIDSVKLLREVKYQEVMFELMVRQYELARVDEAKQAPLIQILDHATPPERKSKPKRALVVLGALFAGVLSALGAVFLREWWANVHRDPGGARALETLRSTWSRRED